MDRDVFIWSGLALLAAIVATPALLAGGFPLLPLFFAGVALAGAAHSGSRALVIGVALRLLSGGALRTAVLVLGALMLIQLLPIELALLMAGDVLAYVEVLAAVSLIAANTRVREVRRAVGGASTDGGGRRRPACVVAARDPSGPSGPAVRRPPTTTQPAPGRSPDAYFSARVTVLTSTYSSTPWMEPSRP